MLRVLYDNWEMTFAYYICQGPASRAELHSFLTTILDVLHDTI